ncbi:MAG: hypothetical protein R3B74_16235 [Nitrospirales bacterium]|nr:hypothetical protein [Nitrospirales bacterium]
MTQEVKLPHGKTTHFDAAKVIVETLQELDKTAQALAMRFAAETLGLQSASIPQSSRPSPMPTPASSLLPGSAGGTTHSMDIKQFTATKAPKSDQQFAAVVAYFYCFEAPEAQRKETIDADSLLEAARLAGRKRPRNARHTLNNAKNAGYLDVVTTGKYRINSVGENLVAMALPGNGPESSISRSVGKKKAVKKPAKKAIENAKSRR